MTYICIAIVKPHLIMSYAILVHILSHLVKEHQRFLRSDTFDASAIVRALVEAEHVLVQPQFVTTAMAE